MVKSLLSPPSSFSACADLLAYLHRVRVCVCVCVRVLVTRDPEYAVPKYHL